MQRAPGRDSFIKLTETNSKAQSKEDMILPIEQPRDDDMPHSNAGIMRTVQIDTTEERIDSPAKVAINGQRLDSHQESGTARMYDYD
jgi:hypothetical protein